VVLQFKWPEPGETGGRAITRYQALALRPGNGSTLDTAAVRMFPAHTKLCSIDYSHDASLRTCQGMCCVSAGLQGVCHSTDVEDPMLGTCRSGKCCAMALTTATS
jgi:hypothetical protein